MMFAAKKVSAAEWSLSMPLFPLNLTAHFRRIPRLPMVVRPWILQAIAVANKIAKKFLCSP
jgi:hypothetical protein